MADKVFEFNGFDVIAQELEVVPKESILKKSEVIGSNGKIIPALASNYALKGAINMTVQELY